MARAMCVSHSQDVDGLVCATLLKIAKNAEYILADYPELLDAIKSVSEDIDTLYICDLTLETPLIDELRRIGRSTKVIYIDHHPFKAGVLDALKESGVKIIHSLDKCAGMLTYRLLKDELPGDASILAAYATLSDYPSNNQESSSFLKRFDPHFLAFEYSLLYYSVARMFDDNQFTRKIVDELSRLKYPHEIENIMTLAMKQIEYNADLLKNADKKVSNGRNLAYIEVVGNTGVAANTLMHVTKKPTLICYGKHGDGRHSNLSIRNNDRRHNLGALTSEVAKKLMGSGGGHPLAAAAQLPEEKITKFIKSIDNAINKQ